MTARFKDGVEIPLALTYKGKPVELCSREELLEALRDSWEEVTLLRALQRVRSHFDAIQQLSKVN